MENKINIYFGKVVDVTDDKKLCRTRININGFTDNIAVDDLPWYFPWYGLNYLPLENDIVPVIVFDGNISTAFYGKKIDISNSTELDESDYASYLELYKRQIDDKQVSLTYTKSKGIEFINDKQIIQIELDKISLFADVNSIVITDKRIDIGNEKQEATILGDKGVKQLQDMITHCNNIVAEVYKIFTAIGTAASGSPFTMPIGAAITAQSPASQAKLTQENTKVNQSTTKIQSTKVFIE